MSSTTIPNIAPWLAVRDAQQAVEFYQKAFGAVELYRLLADDGSLAVAQLSVGGALFWVQSDSTANGRRDRSVRMILSVDDPDSVFERAVQAGASVVAPIHEDYGWRTARVADPFGHDWEVSKQLTS
jgi:PhnB protein